MRSFSVTLQVAIGAKQVEVFEQIVPIELTAIFAGYGLLPTVTGI